MFNKANCCFKFRKKEREDVLAFLRQISGKYTISGIHNREPNAVPYLQTNALISRTGSVPGLWSGDFLFSEDDVAHRWEMIRECERQWKAGSIVNLMLHVTSPVSKETGCWEGDVLCSLSDAQWTDLITDGGELNRIWKTRLDGYANYIRYLQDAGVTILFRPFHEMNQSLFWWGGRPGPNGTAALYRLTHRYLTKEKELNNIIWVWDVQDLDFEWSQYDPGSEYWDVFAVDIYDDDGFTARKYRKALEIAGEKPIAIGECQVLPTSEKLEEQPRWVFFMSWSELTFQYNTDEQINTLFRSDRVIGRKEISRLI